MMIEKWEFYMRLDILIGLALLVEGHPDRDTKDHQGKSWRRAQLPKLGAIQDAVHVAVHDKAYRLFAILAKSEMAWLAYCEYCDEEERRLQERHRKRRVWKFWSRFIPR